MMTLFIIYFTLSAILAFCALPLHCVLNFDHHWNFPVLSIATVNGIIALIIGGFILLYTIPVQDVQFILF